MRCFGGTKKEAKEDKEELDEEKEEMHGPGDEQQKQRGKRAGAMPKSEGDEPNNGRECGTWANGGETALTKRKKLKKRRRSNAKKHRHSDLETEQKQMLLNHGQMEAATAERRTATTTTTMLNSNGWHNKEGKWSSGGAPLLMSGTAEAGGGIEFAKITDRIFALLYPSGSDTLYRQNIKSVCDRIKRTFADRYKIFNLSQKRSDLGRANPQGAVVELGWPDTLAPPLDRLCSICKQIENHQNGAAGDNVTVIHCKGGLYRAGIVVAAFMHYTSINESEANLADRFSMKLFTEKFLGFDAQPSHKRYVTYFASLLSGSVRVYPSPIFLSQLSLSRIFSGQLVTLKMYERMKPIWSSGRISLTDHSLVSLAEGALSLRGDVLLKCCVVPLSLDGLEKQLLFQCQFNTCALNLDASDIAKLQFYKDDLDYVHEGHLLDSSASLELSFELADPQPLAVPPPPVTLNNANNVAITANLAAKQTPQQQQQQRKSSSPAATRIGTTGTPPTIAAGGGDFSRVDSYENFERAEDERSLSLPIGSVVPNDAAIVVSAQQRGEGGGAVSATTAVSGGEQRRHHQQQQQQQQRTRRHWSSSPQIRPKEAQTIQQQQQQQQVQAVSATVPATATEQSHQQQQQAVTTTDGADSGIGSDSPRAQPPQLNQQETMPEGTSTTTWPGKADSNKAGWHRVEDERRRADEMQMASRKVPPPPVPPKSRRNSSMDSDDMEPNDPMRSAYEDSTIGRDHSVLPPGARPTFSRRHSAQGADGMPPEGSSGDEKVSTAPEAAAATTRKVCPMVQPELVAMGRYDPNSRCFSYVPVKALKEHYSAPKKPAPVLKRRMSVVDDLDSPASPTEAQLALQNLGQKSSNGDVRRRAETPKWETEIDKVAGRIEPMPERRPRRTSASYTPVGQLQRDYVRSPSAQVRSAQEEWRQRQPQPQQRRTAPPLETALNGYYERRRGDREGEEEPLWTNPTRATEAYHAAIPRAQTPRDALLTQHAHAERPTVVDQAKRATPVPAFYSSSSQFGAQLPQLSPTAPPSMGLRPSSSVPAPSKLSPRSTGRQEMDTLCDPNFYLSYSTPKAAKESKKRESIEQQQGDLLTKSVPNNRTFRQAAQNELMRDDVRDLLAAHHQLGASARRAQTPQHLEIGGRSRRWAGAAAAPIVQEEFRARNCRSVNSTPLIGSRKLFLHGTEETFGGAASEAEKGADDWLNAKLRALNGKRYMPETEVQRKNAERLLLEELKQKSAAVREPPRAGGGDPLEEYRREAQRLKNTHSPLLTMDNPLRLANKNLQRERARHFLINQPLQTIEPFRTFPLAQRDQTARTPPPFSAMPLSVTTTASSPHNPISMQQQQQQNRSFVESPISVPIRRGATPTAQIVRGKPPTPPPLLSRDDRARSKSPYALKLLRGVSSSAPPAAMAKKGQQQQQGQQQQTMERRESNPMVNPQLYALRQSLYAKERERIDGGEVVAFADEQQHFADVGRDEPPFASSVVPSPAATTFSMQQNNSLSLTSSHCPTFVTEHRTTAPVKPILKRSGTAASNNGGGSTVAEHWQQQTNATIYTNAAGEQHNNTKQYNNDNNQRGSDGGAWRNTTDGRTTSGVKTLVEESRTAAVGRGHQTPADIGERSDTPQFPVVSEQRTETPLPYHPLLYRRDSPTAEETPSVTAQHKQSQSSRSGKLATPTTAASSNRNSHHHNNSRVGAITPHGMYGNDGTSLGANRRASLAAFDSAEVIHHHPVFVKDTSRYWYKPTISREEAIAMLKNKSPGTFIVRDSNSFPGAFGLALKVAQPPAGVPSSADGNELVRHFLIEPSPKGVRLKGCSNEPVFGTLAALVYQHSITPLALPCRLILPELDPAATPEHLNSNQALLERGAACNVTYLCSVDTESLTGPEALRRSAAHCLELLQRRELRAVSVHFKVSSQGITLTDNTRSMFFRRHYPANKVTFAGIDPESRVFDNNNVSQLPPTYVRQAPIFGFVARKCVTSDHSGSVENACHLFAELDPDQPASAVVRFITNVMMPIGRAQLHQIHHSVNAQ